MNKNFSPMISQMRMVINELHVILGHHVQEITIAAGKAMNLKLIGTLKTCEDCALGKVKKAGVVKLPIKRSKVKSKRFFNDIVLHLQ